MRQRELLSDTFIEEGRAIKSTGMTAVRRDLKRLTTSRALMRERRATGFASPGANIVLPPAGKTNDPADLRADGGDIGQHTSAQLANRGWRGYSATTARAPSQRSVGSSLHVGQLGNSIEPRWTSVCRRDRRTSIRSSHSGMYEQRSEPIFRFTRQLQARRP